MPGDVVVLAERDGSSALQQVLEQARISDASARTVSSEEAIALVQSRRNNGAPAVVVIGPTVTHPLRAARQLKAAGRDVYFVFATGPETAAQLRQQLSYSAPPDSHWALEAADSPELGRVIQRAVAAIATQKRLRATLDRINLRISQPRPPDGERHRRLIVSDRYLASILEYAEDAIISLDLAGTVTSWNRGAERLFAVPRSRAIGASVVSLLPVMNGIDETIRHVSSGKVLRTELESRRGSAIKYLDAMFTPIEFEARQVIGLAVIVRDITDRRNAEEALKEADLRKDEFLAVLAHELRNPLAPIRNAVHILNTPELGAAHREWSLRVVDRQVQHMSRLLDDLLDVARISRGRSILKKEEVFLSNAIDAAVEMARPIIDEKNHVLDVDLPAEPILLSADPLRLTQILANLLTNAARYTEASGRIRISVRAEGQSAVVTVADNGIGIASERLATVFEIFAQTPAEHPEAGVGVGLALTRGLVEQHGGKIDAHSEGVGRGSRFVVTLPGRLEVA